MSTLLENLPTDLRQRRIVGTRQACVFVGVSVAHWRRLRARGEAPAPIMLGSKKHGWRISDLDEWLESRSRQKSAA